MSLKFKASVLYEGFPFLKLVGIVIHILNLLIVKLFKASLQLVWRALKFSTYICVISSQCRTESIFLFFTSNLLTSNCFPKFVKKNTHFLVNNFAMTSPHEINLDRSIVCRLSTEVLFYLITWLSEICLTLLIALFWNFLLMILICNFPLLFSHSKNIQMSTLITIIINYYYKNNYKKSQ